MVTVGLTGGIGSGKSTAAGMFKDEGADIIDFDFLARKVIEPGKPAWRKIVEYFGEDFLNPDGSINRGALAEIVFSEEKSRKALERFTHPAILKERDRLVKQIGNEKPSSVVVVDFPLLFELGMAKDFDKTVLVYVSRDEQIKRVMQRDSLSKEDVEKRINAQMDIDEKKRLADYIIDAEMSFAAMRDQVKGIMHSLRGISEKKIL